MFRTFWSILFIFCIGGPSQLLLGQVASAEQDRSGLFISSKYFSYSENFYKEVSQFLTIDDDRSWVGKMKPEFIIRMGWLLQEQLQKLTDSDTTYFMNAEPQLGHTLLNTYDFEERSFNGSQKDFEGINKLYIVNSFEIRSRKHRSVYIRSNRMLTEYIPVMVLVLKVQVVDLQAPQKSVLTEVCFDAMNTKVETPIFDLYSERSRMGKFLSDAFSQWWVQFQAGIPSNCAK